MMNRKLKKKLIITLSAAVLIFIISLLVSPYVFEKRFDSFIGRNRNKITRVHMINGSNGLNVSTTDRSKIEKIISRVDNRKYF
jgi:preprotein translocase subunit SecY